MNIYIFEYFSAGGSIGGSADESMLAEGAAMLNSALADFSRVDGVKPYFTQDFEAGLDNCTAALIIAPETDGILQRLTRLVCDKGKVNLGSSPEAIATTGDKLAFAKVMEGEGIAHPKTCLINDRFDPKKEFSGKWVSKPIDGAGSDGVIVHDDWPPTDYKSVGHIAQRFTEGDPMSLSIVSSESESHILSINKQYLSSSLKYEGGEITGLQPDDDLQRVVNKIKVAIPGLKGYWGIDYVATSDGPVVIEVNPRLTTSYSALSRSLNINPAEMIVAAKDGETNFNTKGELSGV